MTLSPAAAIVCGIVAFAAPAAAHSPKELEGQLAQREPYSQSFEREAPDFALLDSEGQVVRLADFLGKVVVLNFIYASCPDFCPLHTERIIDIQTMVNQTPARDRVQFISVTTDPGTDTAAVMRKYGPARGLDPFNWRFVTSGSGRPEGSTRALAKQYGHSFTKTDEGYQLHSVVTHVIDAQGRWRANFYGLDFQPANMVDLINALSDDPDKPDRGAGGLWHRFQALFGD